MAHWFHRNPLKSTKQAKYELKSVITTESASKICSELRLLRVELLEHMETVVTDLETIEKEFTRYLILLRGFLFDFETDKGQQQTSEVKHRNSKLRYLLKFTWAHSLTGHEKPIELSDSWYETLNIIVQMGLWHMKRAAWISAKDDVNDIDAKNIYRSLRRAAGLFQFVLFNTDKLGGMAFPGNDFDQNIVETYVEQCCAEAQEIAIARAIEFKHAPSLISALAFETSEKYKKCDKMLEQFSPEVFEKWRCYLQLKQKLYEAYAYAYQGEILLAEDKCGNAVRVCRAGISSYNEAQTLCVRYAKAKGPGFIAKPQEHLFFRKVEPLLRRHLEKAERENSFIYHQSVPDECPSLEKSVGAKETSFGLVKPESFELPSFAEPWTTAVYRAFDVSKAITPDFAKAKIASKPLPPVKEEKLYTTDRDPKNASGCIIS